jgi:hypothetical protein
VRVDARAGKLPGKLGDTLLLGAHPSILMLVPQHPKGKVR